MEESIQVTWLEGKNGLKVWIISPTNFGRTVDSPLYSWVLFRVRLFFGLLPKEILKLFKNN